MTKKKMLKYLVVERKYVLRGPNLLGYPVADKMEEYCRGLRFEKPSGDTNQ